MSARVIGVGNPDRGDDALGWRVLDRLRSMDVPGLECVRSVRDGSRLLEAWEGAASVVLVDAVVSGRPPGTLHRFDASAAPIPSRLGGTSTHALGVAEAIELGRVLGRLPGRLVVYGVEGRRFGPGEALSEDLEPAVRETADRIAAEWGEGGATHA